MLFKNVIYIIVHNLLPSEWSTDLPCRTQIKKVMRNKF